MVNFDIEKEGFKNKFIKNNPSVLRQFYGTDEVTPYWIADMDFEIAAPITKELQRLVERGIYAYESDTDGIYSAIVNWNKERHNLKLEKESLLTTPNVLAGIALLVRELTDQDDGILIQTPVYHQFSKLIKTAGRRVVKNPLQIIDGKYEMDFPDLEQKLQSEKVKVIVLCNPHNPVGRVWTQSELEQLIALADKYDAKIISDEIHSDILYSGNRFNSIMSMGAENHIAVLGSPAKTFGMQSISNGYLYIPEQKSFHKVQNTIESMYLGHGNAFTTCATIAAYNHGAAWVDSLVAYLEKTVTWIDDYLAKEIPELTMFPVEGTYQIWLDFSALFNDETELTEFVAQQAKLGLAPGKWFGEDSGLFMRMNIASPIAKIQSSLTHLAAALKTRSSK